VALSLQLLVAGPVARLLLKNYQQAACMLSKRG
jgi:hypothetical protein